MDVLDVMEELVKQIIDLIVKNELTYKQAMRMLTEASSEIQNLKLS